MYRTMTVDFGNWSSGFAKKSYDRSNFDISFALQKIRDHLHFYRLNSNTLEKHMMEFQQLQIAGLIFFSNLIESAGLRQGETFE